MKKIDQYIFGKYIKLFFFLAITITVVAITFDYSEKVDKFQDIPFNEILLNHYLPFIPYINGRLCPIYVLFTVIFFTSRMANEAEIISVLNAGVSFQRLLMPYLAAAGLITTVYLVGNHIIIPKSDKLRLNFEHTYITPNKNDKSKIKNVHLFVAPQTKVYINYYNKNDTSARNFRLERFENEQLVYLLKANKAEWLSDSSKWRLHNYELRTFEGMRETYKRTREKMDTTLNLYPQDFIYYENQKQGMTTPEIQQFMQRERDRGVGNTKIYQIEAYKRTAEAFTIIILTLIGVAVAARKKRGGIGLNLVIGALTGAVFIFLSKIATTFAMGNSFPALLGVWIPNIIFSIVAVYLISKAQK